MLDKFIFENHLGQRFVGLENGVYMNYGQLRDYAWKYDTINSKISRFFYGIKDAKIPLVCMSATEDEATRILNQLHELAAADIEAINPGRIYCGEYYTRGYITASKKMEYLINKRYCKIELTLTREDQSWYREHVYEFYPTPNHNVGEGHDYPYDYPYDYSTKSMTMQNIECDSVSANAFKICIFGSVSNPSIKIGGHEYSINGTIGSGEWLEIDGLAKKIWLHSQTGQKLNWFDRRNRDSYIFEPIPAGMNAISWDGSFGFNLTVIEKRSEPRWI